jgi:hypothetical protein
MRNNNFDWMLDVMCPIVGFFISWFIISMIVSF